MNNQTPMITSDFIREKVADDVKSGKLPGKVITRFPPEPNGYLHIGHAKSICLNFGIALEFNGQCNLRMDDTNPTKEDTEYVESIIQDVHWLIDGWADHVLGPKVFYASDYFDQLYQFAIELIKKGKAYVCDLSAEELAEYRGAPDRPGRESPYRNRSIEENLDLFQRMKAGEFPDGSKTLRAKIDMASPNIHMRDPALYRIRHTPHHRTGNKWCIYPTYDYAHCLSDAIEGITHSICTLEFEVHRPLYDWILEQLVPEPRPHQYEFARLNLGYTVMSKRRLLELVEGKFVSGWNDPRLPTIAGMRRRGYTPEAIRNFCSTIGVTKYEGITDFALLEHCLRDHLNKHALRVMGVLNPLKVVIINYPENQSEELDAINNPEDPSAGTRKIPFSKVIYIDRDDFRESPPPGYYRLSPGNEVRLKYAYIIKCIEVIKNPETNEIVELKCVYDPDTKSGSGKSQRKVKGTIHWVSANHAIPAEVRLYDRLFTVEDPSAEAAKQAKDFKEFLNPDSLKILKNCMLEPSLAKAQPNLRYQFERVGYFCIDYADSKPNHLVFNRIVTLKDTWAKLEKKL